MRKEPMKVRNSLNIMKKISKRHLKLYEKNIILPEESGINSRYVYIHILFTFLVYRESAQEKIPPPIIFKITGKVVIPLVYRSFQPIIGGNRVVIKVVISPNPHNIHVATLQPYAYIPP
jgi:hypothetical protein